MLVGVGWALKHWYVELYAHSLPWAAATLELLWCGVLLLGLGLAGRLKSVAGQPTHKRLEFANYCMSVPHALVAVHTGWWNLSHGEDWLAGDICTGQSIQRDAMLFFTACYLAADAVVVTIGWRLGGDNPVEYYFHHALVGGSTLLAVHHSFGSWTLATLLLNELSTLFMQARYFLVTLGYRNSVLYVINGALFTLMFFLSRVVLLPVVFWLYSQHQFCWQADRALWMKVLALVNFPVLWGLNLLWFHKLALGAIKVLRGNKEL